jgi:hypothetical protein
VDAEVQAAIIAALATIVAAVITTAGYLYVELRRRSGRSRARAAEPVEGDDHDQAVDEAGPAEEPAKANGREQR